MKPEKNISKLEHDLISKADLGGVQAKIELGLFYEKQKLWTKAEEWYLRAAEDYNDNALIMLGSLYLTVMQFTK